MASPLKVHEKRVSFDDSEEEVTSLAFNSSGTLLASGSVDGSIKVWDWQKHTPLSLPLMVHPGGVIKFLTRFLVSSAVKEASHAFKSAFLVKLSFRNL